MKALLIRYFKLIIVIPIIWLGCTKNSSKPENTTDIYKSYVNDKGASYFLLPPRIVSVFLDEEQRGNNELKELLKDTKQLSILIVKKDKEQKENLHFLDLNKRLDAIDFNDLAIISTGNEVVRVKIKQDKDIINEMVVLISNLEAIYCISFRGEIAADKIVELNHPDNLASVSNLNRFKP